ncbi:hypothetical protein LDENG_00220110 [Lucifuga dentata]|nr:hypothetical protein LDENG_00220110 [Lucifuga dentata]
MYQELREFIRSKKSSVELSETQCSALVFLLLMSQEVLDQFHMKMIRTSAEGHRRLMLALRNCRKAHLFDFGLSEKDYCVLAVALSTSPSHLTELDMTGMEVPDSGMKLLCERLQSPCCGVESLTLRCCTLSEHGFASLASVLSCSHSLLRTLDLRTVFDLFHVNSG